MNNGSGGSGGAGGGGYSEIVTGGASDTSSEQDDNNNNETTGLLTRSSRVILNKTQRWFHQRWKVITVIVAICLLSIGIIHSSRRKDEFTGGGKSGQQQTIIEVGAGSTGANEGNGGDRTAAGTDNKILFRPVCEYYYAPPSPTAGAAAGGSGNNKNKNQNQPKIPRIIETSMTHPSQHWALKACFPASNPPTKTTIYPPSSGGTVAGTTTTKVSTTAQTTILQHPPLKSQTTQIPSRIVELNSYGAPDAILQVNFSQLAFPQKQTPILGFGGAVTEAAALNYNRLSPEGKDTVMELMFGSTGLGYSFGRVHINSCDFSIESYSFDDVEDDFNLQHFDMDVSHDANVGMIEMTRKASSVFKKAWGQQKSDTPVTTTENKGFGSTILTSIFGNGDNIEDAEDGNLKLIASPWSPPSWMKKPTWEDSKHAKHASKMTYSGSPNCLREGVGKASRYAKSWALYFSKFLTAYSNLGLPIWAVTVQNEPEFPAPWEACSYTPNTQREFVAHHLGPRLSKDHPDTKLFVFDHNKDHINTWGEMLLNSSSHASKYVDGTAYHWYAGGMDRLLDGAIGIPNMHRYQQKLETFGIEDKHLLLGTEACHCPTTGYSGGDINVYWSRAERYAHTILADLAAGSNGWVEWNLILDGIGGPNHLGNICESTILSVPHRAKGADPDAIPPLPDFEKKKPMGNVSIGDGRTLEELHALGFPAKYLEVGVAVQPIYFYMGHVSRYVRPGSVAVMGLVNQALGNHSRIFWPDGQKVAGGGMNDLARKGIEVTLWPCEGSTRQQFKLNERSKKIEVFGHDFLGEPTKNCVARKVDKDLMGLRLTECDKTAGTFQLTRLDNENRTDVYHIVLQNYNNGECLVIEELKNNGGAYGMRGGAQVSLGNCAEDSAKWIFNEEKGEFSSTYFADDRGDNEVCVTTGWPFLQMGAFLTPNGESPKTVIIHNEAKDSANYALQDENGVVLTSTIPPRSIQTVLLD